MKTEKNALVLLALMAAFFGADALAQAIPQTDQDSAVKQQNRIQQRQRQNARELRRAIEDIKGKPGGIEIKPSPDGLLPEGTKGCFQVDQIQYLGSTLLSEEEKEGFSRPFLGKGITLDAINDLLRAVTNDYVDRGFVTSRAFLRPQDITDRSLDITVVEGTIELIEINGGALPVRRQKISAFPGLEGGFLNLRDLEQGLDQMNRLASSKATMKLEPGDSTGASKVVITNEITDPNRISFTLDNHGGTSTGERRGTATLAFDNLLDLNDAWSFSYVKDNHGHGADFGNKTYSGYFSIPVGYWSFSLTSSFYKYLSTFEGTTSRYNNSGISRSHEANLDWVAHRNADGKTTLGGLFRSYNAKNYLDETKLETSSYRLSVLGGSLSHERKLLGGAATVTGTYERGLRSWSAIKDPHYVEDPSTARAQFAKAQLDLSFQRPIKDLPLPVSYAFHAHGQWTPHTLYSAEQISVGGRTSVRGFDESNISGDIGGYIRNDLTVYLPKTDNTEMDSLLGQTSLTLSYDAGALRKDAKDYEERGAMTGWAMALKTSGDNLDLNLSYAKALRAPSSVHKRGYETYLSATVNF